MDDLKTRGSSSPRGFAAHCTPPLLLAGLTLLAALPFFLLVYFVPRAAVLPVFSLAAIGVAAAIALVAHLRGARWDGEAITLWDMAGASMLFGCAAAVFSNPEDIRHWFGESIVP